MANRKASWEGGLELIFDGDMWRYVLEGQDLYAFILEELQPLHIEALYAAFVTFAVGKRARLTIEILDE